jgi:hypothetical protein
MERSTGSKYLLLDFFDLYTIAVLVISVEEVNYDQLFETNDLTED